MIPFIDLKTQYQSISENVQERINRVLEHGQFIMGPEVAELEAKLAEYVGVKHCISASSGTDTLLIALMALGIGRGDEVITTPFSFIATGEMIVLAGAKPVFVDIDHRTYNIDASLVEAAVTPRTRAIMPVGLYGQCSDMDAINEIASRHDLPVIEDAAQSFGADYEGRKSCGLSTIGSTSFFPSKPLGCYGDGGALFTDSDELAKSMREIRVHGQDRRYNHPRIGINGRLDTIQAAILLAKFERFEWELVQRQTMASRYRDLLAEAETFGAVLPWVEDGRTSVYAQFTLAVPNRDEVCKQLNASGIPTAIHYPLPLHLQGAFSGLGNEGEDFPNAEKSARSVMSIPTGPDLSAADQDEIVEKLMDILRRLSIS